jgi:hypothetical protein
VLILLGFKSFGIRTYVSAETTGLSGEERQRRRRDRWADAENGVDISASEMERSQKGTSGGVGRRSQYFTRGTLPSLYCRVKTEKVEVAGQGRFTIRRPIESSSDETDFRKISTN